MFSEKDRKEIEQEIKHQTFTDDEAQIDLYEQTKIKSGLGKSFSNKFKNLQVKYKKDKRKTLVALAAILAMFSLLCGSSYAYLTYVSKTNNSVTISIGSLALIFQNEENAITLQNAVPVKDSVGLASDKEYSFEVKNTGDIPANYTITLDNTCTTGSGVDTCIPDEYIKVGIKIGSGSYKVVERNDKNKYVIETGSLEANKVQSYKMKIWLAHRTPNTYNGADNKNIYYKGKLGLTYEQGKTAPEFLEIMKKLANTNQTINYGQAPSDTNGNGINILEGTENDQFPIYFYRGFDTSGKHVVSNNNVLFGGFCWKIVRTTDTGGIKIIYNGTQKTTYESMEKINQSSYTSVNNDATYPYTFDTASQTWTSTNHNDSTTGTITFKLNGAGNYILNYKVSSETNYDKAKIYKDNTLLKTTSGTQEGTIDLSGITAETVIKVEYTKDGSQSSGTDNVIFSIAKTEGEVLSCDNTGSSAQLTSTSRFGTYSTNSPAYNGYMYGTIYTYKSTSAASDATYGSGFTYSGDTYTLTDAQSAKDNTHHYSCDNSTGTCSTIRYYYYGNYFIELTGGDGVEQALAKMQTNTTNSTIKQTIDTWYENNLTSYSNYLEDTVWCNDRSMNTGTNGWKENGSLTENMYYASYGRNSQTYHPSVTCSNKNDAFTVNDTTKGNGALTYPIALLTADEVTMAGSGLNGYSASSYLNTGNVWWTMSPYYFTDTNAYVFDMASSGKLSYYSTSNSSGVRPSVSLKPGTKFTSGDGSSTNPYIVE